MADKLAEELVEELGQLDDRREPWSTTWTEIQQQVGKPVAIRAVPGIRSGSVVGSMQLQASQKQIQMTTDFSASVVPLVEADQALLYQALNNLVDNAIKYTEANGRVVVRLRPDQERMLVEINDSGIGIAPVDLPHVFERFWRADPSRTRGERPAGGTGLGLSVAQSLVVAQGGRIWVESAPGEGTVVRFTLPLLSQKPTIPQPAAG